MDGVDIEVVCSYMYLGVHLDDRLDWSLNTTAIFKKGGRVGSASSAGCARSMCAVTCCTFHRSVVESALLYV